MRIQPSPAACIKSYYYQTYYCHYADKMALYIYLYYIHIYIIYIYYSMWVYFAQGVYQVPTLAPLLNYVLYVRVRCTYVVRGRGAIFEKGY